MRKNNGENDDDKKLTNLRINQEEDNKDLGEGRGMRQRSSGLGRGRRGTGKKLSSINKKTHRGKHCT